MNSISTGARLATGLATVLLLSACAALKDPSTVPAAKLQDAARLKAIQATVWSDLAGSDATVRVVEVNGAPRHGDSSRLKLDDDFLLAPGTHALGVLLAGHPTGSGLEGREGLACLHLDAAPRARYVLRGAVSGGAFSLRVNTVNGVQETTVATIPVAFGSAHAFPVCSEPPPGSAPLAAVDGAG